MNMKILTIATITGTVLLVVCGGLIGLAAFDRFDRLAKKAATRDEMCRLTKATLFVDRTSIGSPGEFDRVVHKVNTEDMATPYAMGDNAYFIRWCAAIPFPETEWQSCVEHRDVACAQDVLKRVEDSVAD